MWFMGSIIPGFANDVLISHSTTQNTCRDEGWMTVLSKLVREKLNDLAGKPLSVIHSIETFAPDDDEFRTIAAVRVLTHEYAYTCSDLARKDLNQLVDKVRLASETRSRIMFIEFAEYPSGSEAFNFASWVGEQEYPYECSLYDIYSAKPDGFRHEDFCKGADVLAQKAYQALSEMQALLVEKEKALVVEKALDRWQTEKGFFSCFISYSSGDQDFVEHLYSDLQRMGVRCWYAPEDLRIGDSFRSAIDESIKQHDKVLIILSENSVRSPWVASEVEAAFERESRQPEQTVLFPIRLDDAVMTSSQAWSSEIRRRRHIGNFQDWRKPDSYKSAFTRLLRDLKVDRSGASPE